MNLSAFDRPHGFIATGSVQALWREQLLVGREAECARIDELLAAARRQRSGALVLTGDAGVGKSALCGWAVAQAREMRVLAARGVESEADLRYAGLSELCADQRDLAELLPAPQVRALQAVLALRDGPPVDRFAVGAAVLSLLAAGGECNSTLVVVDDAQWIDASSADALLFAARRMRREGVALLVTTRPGGTFDGERTDLPRLRIGGLDQRSARTLLAATHGQLPSEVVSTVVDGTHGNPLALIEVPRLLSDAQLAGEEPIDEPLPTGVALERALLRQLSDLTVSTRQGLLVAAASGTERLQPVLDALGVLGLSGELDAAEEAGVLAIAGERFEFRHPLLRSAVYHGASGPDRRAAHAALARMTSGEARAWQLAQATVGEAEPVAATLEQIGIEARRRGAPAAGAAAFRHAARLSGPGEARVRRLTEAARDAHLAGQPTGALRLLDTALAGASDPAARADVQHLRGRLLVLQGQTDIAYRLLVDEARRVREISADRSASMLAEACLHCMLSADVQGAIAAAREACGVAAEASPAVQASAGVMLASALVLAGERWEASALLDRLLPLLRLADPLSEAGALIFAAAQSYFWLERYDVASELLGQLTNSAREASAPATLLMPLCCRAELDLRTGRWALAAAELEEAATLGEEMAQSVWAAYAFECLACLAAVTGDERGCRDQAARALALIDKHHNEIGRLYVQSALGLLELGLGQIEAALCHLEPARDLANRHKLAEPNVVHWQADLIEAYVRAGEAVAAQCELAAFERQADRTGGRWARGTAARCRGLLADDTEADGWFVAAVEQLDAVGARFEIARTQLCRGERLRRAGRRSEARQALRLAIDGFEQLGAKPWVARAQTELRASGQAPRRRRDDADRDQLTAHELQVALIVARGASNREAAAALFLSTKTIEFHLANVYRKLEVRTRAQLAALAARRGWLDSPGPPAVARQT